jgi:hypothetical protein
MEELSIPQVSLYNMGEQSQPVFLLAEKLHRHPDWWVKLHLHPNWLRKTLSQSMIAEENLPASTWQSKLFLYIHLHFYWQMKLLFHLNWQWRLHLHPSWQKQLHLHLNWQRKLHLPPY